MTYMADIARSVVRYQPADKPALREFQRAHFGPQARHCDDAFAEWLFERNPNRDAEGPALWLCKRDGVVVGQQGGIPVVLKVGDRECRAMWNIDWMVHPAWRMKGVAPALFTAFAESSDILLGLGVEDVPYRSFVRSGWIDMGSLQLFVRPLNPSACAKGLNAPRLLTQLAPGPLFRGSAAFAGRAAAMLARVSLEPVDAFDERVNGVWKRASKDYPVLVKRDYAFLSWRYDDSPHRVHYARYYMMRKGEVLGYMVVRLEPWHGHMIARVVDYMAPRRWVAALLALTIRRVNAQGAVAVFIEQQDVGTVKVLWSLGCIRVRASHRFMLKLREPASALAGPVTDAANWFVMPGDGDYDQVMIEAE